MGAVRGITFRSTLDGSNWIVPPVAGLPATGTGPLTFASSVEVETGGAEVPPPHPQQVTRAATRQVRPHFACVMSNSFSGATAPRRRDEGRSVPWVWSVRGVRSVRTRRDGFAAGLGAEGPPD